MQEKNVKCRELVGQLCLLFGCNVVLQSTISAVLVEGGFLTDKQIESLMLLKETILERLRPKLIGLVDAFGFPEHLIRS